MTGDGRARLAHHLDDDLAREYQAIIAYVVYSQVLTGAETTSVDAELAKHGSEELQRAIASIQQIDMQAAATQTEPG